MVWSAYVCVCVIVQSIKETDGVVKRAGEMKSGPSNVSVIHFQNDACFDASSRNGQTLSTKINIYFYGTHYRSIRFCDSEKAITRPPGDVPRLMYCFISYCTPRSLSFCSRLPDKSALYLMRASLKLI